MTWPEKRIAIVGSRFGLGVNTLPFGSTTRPGLALEPEWRAQARASAEAAVLAYVSRLPSECMLVSGGAVGVDSWARRANRSHRPFVELAPAWNGPSGSAAGLERNAWIVALASSVVVFWDGRSRGSADTIRTAQAAGKLSAVYVYDEQAPNGRTLYQTP